MWDASTVLSAEGATPSLTELRQAITEHYLVDEEQYLKKLMALLDTQPAQRHALTHQATELVNQVRQHAKGGDGVDALLQQYSLDTQEGIVLMCLAEALLRIPDAETADALIKDKLSSANWRQYVGNSESLLVNASAWGLLLTGKVLGGDRLLQQAPGSVFERMVHRLGEPVVRQAMYTAMKIMGKQFVLGRDIKEAVKVALKQRSTGYTHTFDMLGEAALTQADADRYHQSYLGAIETMGQGDYANEKVPAPSISIKLSALHPRYEEHHRERVLTEMADSVLQLVKRARELDVAISIDAEEMDRLELSLDLIEKLYRSPAVRGWGRFGVVVQAYSKRALPVLCWLNTLASEVGDPIPVRLVKGAYWDTELKISQQLGLTGYPLFTRKAATDVSYLACSRYLLSDQTRGKLEPQFASHNAHTVSAILQMAPRGRSFEFQRLHGMGEELYDTVLRQNPDVNCRIYAPVGAHKDLLPYLVRRLLENGANTSFVHKLVDPKTPVDSLVAHPVDTLLSQPTLANHRIPQPTAIYGQRKNSSGLNLTIAAQRDPFMARLQPYLAQQWQGGPIVDGTTLQSGTQHQVLSPQDARHVVGSIHWAGEAAVEQALASATAAFPAWNRTPVDKRARILEQLADTLEANREELIGLCVREAGKTLQDSIDEIREAVDFCRFYAVQARKLFTSPSTQPGPTGELNLLGLQGRGVFVCISPWNFPLAIFLGQIAAALAAGNTVIAKPAEQTGLIAWRTIELLHGCGVPRQVVQLLPGDGASVGAALTQDLRVAGVCFTGSTDTAQLINRTLATRGGAIVPLIAETGGQNAMIVDSSALPEQVVKDVVDSAFTSAGQRCSACRVLYLQDDVADRIIELIKGAMAELHIGDPSQLNTDVGPVIDDEARQNLMSHIAAISSTGKPIAQLALDEATQHGHFVPPTAVEISSINQLEKEQFGPVLHVVRYQAKDLDRVIADINATGYGLTLGIHSRNESRAMYIAERINAGNVYINRNQIGALVESQPFGGAGLSGTGPKAGGPHYLLRFASEKTISNNITAMGGNATLLSLGDG